MNQISGRVATPAAQHMFRFIIAVLMLAGMFLLWQNRQILFSMTQRPADPPPVVTPANQPGTAESMTTIDKQVLGDYLRNTIKSIDSATADLTKSQKNISQVLP